MKATATTISRRNLVGKIGKGVALTAAAAALPREANAVTNPRPVHPLHRTNTNTVAHTTTITHSHTQYANHTCKPQSNYTYYY